MTEGDIQLINGAMKEEADLFRLAGKSFKSRLLVGTGRYHDPKLMQATIKASGAEIVTMAIRRVNVEKTNDTQQNFDITEYLKRDEYTYLPNSAGCYSALEAVRVLRLAKVGFATDLVKLEVIQDKISLLPNMPETIKAAEMLVKEGFAVMVYSDDNLESAKILEELGCAAVMPLAAPIGSGLGILNPDKIKAIVNALKIPVLVDAGIGTASDAVLAMELGCAGVLMNTAISDAEDPVKMAKSMQYAVISGRLAYLAGRMQKKFYASTSSPAEGIIGQAAVNE